MRLFKNKFFIIALAAALILATCATVLSVMGIEAPLRSIFGTLATPFRWCAAQISQGIAGFTAYFTEFDRLADENAALRDENAALKQSLADAQAAIKENEILRDYVGLEALKPEWKLTDAIVIGRESGSYMTVYTLNRGSLHGIKKNMPVITADGIVGYVRETGLAWCIVVPITETTASVGAYVERSGAAGIVSGDFSLRADGLCRMTYIDSGADIAVGDQVISSGTGSIYPAGLLIGTVSALTPDEISRTYTATITPAVDFTKLTRAMIITSYTLVPDTAEAETTAEITP